MSDAVLPAVMRLSAENRLFSRSDWPPAFTVLKASSTPGSEQVRLVGIVGAESR